MFSKFFSTPQKQPAEKKISNITVFAY